MAVCSHLGADASGCDEESGRMTVKSWYRLRSRQRVLGIGVVEVRLIQYSFFIKSNYFPKYMFRSAFFAEGGTN